MPIEQPQRESTYVIDSESAAETARLMHQDRLITQAMVYANDFRGVWYYLRVWGTKA